MNNRLKTLNASVLALVLLAILSSSSLAGTVWGRVVNTHTGLGVPDIFITVRDADSYDGITGAGGYYSIDVPESEIPRTLIVDAQFINETGLAGQCGWYCFPYHYVVVFTTGSAEAPDIIVVPYSIFGTVHNYYTGEGVDGVTIAVSNGGDVVVTSGGGQYCSYAPCIPYWTGGTMTLSYNWGSFTAQSIPIVPYHYSYCVWNGIPVDFYWLQPFIEGYVTTSGTGTVVQGVTITFSDGGGSAVTDSNGYYSWLVLEAGWSGTATPSLQADGSFGPASRSYSNVTSDQTDQDYVWLPDLTISGRVTQAGTDDGVAGVTITFTNDEGSPDPDGSGATTTNSSGYYSWQVPYTWSGTATPSYTSGSFDPPSMDYFWLLYDVTDQDYTWLPDFTISGRVTQAGTGDGVDGVTITFSDSLGSATASTSGGGYYSKQVTYGWSGTAIPSYTSGTFSPEYRIYDYVTSDETDQDYVWTAWVTLTVESDTPPSGVKIFVTPRDKNGHADGTTTFQRVYLQGTNVMLYAPGTVVIGNKYYVFYRWTIDGKAETVGLLNPSFAMSDDCTAVATYNRIVCRLSVLSTPITGVHITGTPAGVTNYSKLLDYNSLVTLKAAATAAGGYVFLQWNQKAYGNSTLKYTIKNNSTATAKYGKYKLLKITGPTPVNELSHARYICKLYCRDGRSYDITNYARWTDSSAYCHFSAPGLLVTSSVPASKRVSLSATYAGRTCNYNITIRNTR